MTTIFSRIIFRQRTRYDAIDIIVAVAYFWLYPHISCFAERRSFISHTYIPGLPFFFAAFCTHPTNNMPTLVCSFFCLEGLADGYAWELRRRLICRASDPTLNNNEGLSTTRTTTTTRTSSTPNKERLHFQTAVDGSASSLVISCAVDDSAVAPPCPVRLEELTAIGENKAAELSGFHEQHQSDVGPVAASTASHSNVAPVGISVRGSKDRDRAESSGLVFALLEVSLRCRHAWLCSEAFCEATEIMGNGDGNGLPANPRELAALIALLQRFLSALFLVGGKEEKKEEVSREDKDDEEKEEEKEEEEEKDGSNDKRAVDI